VLLNQLVQTSDKVASTSGRLAKIKLLAELLKQAVPDEIEAVIAYLSGTIRQAKVGVGWATLQAAKGQAAKRPTIALKDVDAALDLVANATGKGSAALKTKCCAISLRGQPHKSRTFCFDCSPVSCARARSN